MVLLNLAYIPDSVIRTPEFNFQAGWQFYFKKRMERYIEDFNVKAKSGEQGQHGQTYDIEWKFQDEELETRYNDFRLKRDAALGVERHDKKPLTGDTGIN